MSRGPTLAALGAAMALAACNQPQAPTAAPAARDIPVLALNDAVEHRIGGPDTCVVLADAESGQIVYQYGMPSVCMRRLPPCATDEIGLALLGLDASLVTPETVFKWNGKPQAASVWEKDADMRTAFAQSNPWWFAELVSQMGAKARDAGLEKLGYDVETGVVSISTREQAALLHDLDQGRLQAEADSAAAVSAMMRDGKAASCPSNADGSRSVGWYLGHVRSDTRPLIVAASIEGDQGLPGREVQERVAAALAEAGLKS